MRLTIFLGFRFDCMNFIQKKFFVSLWKKILPFHFFSLMILFSLFFSCSTCCSFWLIWSLVNCTCRLSFVWLIKHLLASLHCKSSTLEEKSVRLRRRMQLILYYICWIRRKIIKYGLWLEEFFFLHNKFSKHLIACALVLCGSCSEASCSVHLINMWLLLPKSQDLFRSLWCVLYICEMPQLFHS